MPNHVQNEIIFENINQKKIKEILAKVFNKKENRIDFNILVPQPLNIWKGTISTMHEEAFPSNSLEWNKQNWGTKCNAYDSNILFNKNKLILKFKTAQNPPRGLVVAIFNYFKLPFKHLWINESNDIAYIDTYKVDKEFRNNWVCEKANQEQQKYMYQLLYGGDGNDNE